MNKKLVIFDLDGTLLNTIDDLAVSANYALRQHGYPEHELPAYRYFVGNGITKLIERALPEAERCEPTILQLREEFVGYYQRHKTDLTRPYPGIPELLSHLSAKGIQLAVASNKYHQGTVELISIISARIFSRLYWDNAGTYLQNPIRQLSTRSYT